MDCKCPSCSSPLVKQNGRIHTGKQGDRCLKCDRQFILDPTQNGSMIQSIFVYHLRVPKDRVGGTSTCPANIKTNSASMAP